MVWIEKLIVKGFKSFGRDNITIKFNPGFTCVAGPNGSGKSNVIDAILFVLGQLSAKTLRATVFSDLLYSPPKPTMPPKAKSAIVELHFNNKDRKLQVDADKVVVVRELDDTGKSVCRINQKTVTRAAVLDVLGSIGVDPNGYNLVLQGEIAQMVKVSPNDRRKLIEEIAGIAAYDEQKDRALKKLAESETNLGKVETQLQERRRQLERLQGERDDALRYTEIRNRIQEIRIDSLAWNVIKGKNRIQTINETLAERAAEAENLTKEFDEVEKKLIETEAEIEDIDQVIDQITGGDSARISEQFGIVSAAVNHVKADLERARAEFEKANREHDSVAEELAVVQEEIESSQQMVDEKSTRLKTIEDEIEGCTKKIKRLEERAEKEQSVFIETTQRLQDLNTQMAAMDEGVSEVRSAIKTDSKELGMAYEEVRDSEEGLQQTNEELKELSDIIPTRREELQSLEESEVTRQAELAKIEERLSFVNAEVDESAKIVYQTREELVKLQARQDALREAEEAFLKRRKAVARVLELRDAGAVEGIHGTVAELGTIDPEYAVALEIAGGNRLTHVVVKDEDVATQCVELLKHERVGRASFIPLSRIKAKAPGKLPSDGTVIGFAIDLVDFDQKYLPAFEFVFSDTIVAEDFETAKRLGFKGKRVVSLEGDLVERSGLITGGYHQRGSSGLSLQLEDKTPEVTKRLEGLEKILTDLRSQQHELRQQRDTLEADLQNISNKMYREKLELSAVEERQAEKKARAEILGKKITTAKATIDALESQIEELRIRDTELSEHRERVRAQRDEANEVLVKSGVSDINQEIKDLKEILEVNRQEREELSNTVTGYRVAVDERLSPKATELRTHLQDLKDTLPGLEESMRRLELDTAERDSEFQKLKTERERIDDAVKDKRVRQVQLKEDLRNLRARHEEIREAQTQNEKAVYRLQTEQSRLETDMVAISAELGSMTQIDDELEKRAKKPELTYREIEDLGEKIRELERELEAMGPVNLKSLTDYTIEREKYDEIVEKKTRLEEEHKEILAFMEEIEAEKTQKFLQVYNEIADNFSKVFGKLSPGGEASLMLENPEHPLMGGITVRSKPRGKDLVTLDAMSGGEKTLTGLALIFAIQMYNPASFYVFDEIDAALDDVNAHNVALLISEMAKSSQFIVVSLRNTTLRKADLLIGVSNQDGISRIVSVDLEEVSTEA
ncbi:MAG: chromosome segregation protein SMC [Candidatus Thorarchaeota archaeon]